MDAITIKQLTIKTLALIALSSSDRGQTLHLLNIDNITKTEDGLSFVIYQKLKHTRKSIKPKVVECVTHDNDSLNVANYVTEYMERTSPWREDIEQAGSPKPKQLFLSWATKRPVTKQTLARWLKTALSMAGIDISQFKAHSFRGAGLSAAAKTGASIEQIVKHGQWKGPNTFHKYYSAPATNSTVGQIILSNVASGECAMNM